MWGENWGTMFWGGAAPVSSLGPGALILLIAGLISLAWIAQRRGSTVTAVTLMVAVVAMPLIAVAATSLPNTFTNGTIADATQVNGNFDTIIGDFSRYQLSVTGSSEGTSAPVPASVITQLCEDEDGCEVRLLSRNRNFMGDFPFATGPYLFHVNSSARWSVSLGTTVVAQAMDGDSTVAHVAQNGSDCFFTDGEYVSFTSTDASPGFNLLLWNGGNNPNRTCQLTITD